jgi:hypothetical protein
MAASLKVPSLREDEWEREDKEVTQILLYLSYLPAQKLRGELEHVN